MPPRTPRLDAYGRMLKRLYEAAFLLHRLGPSARPHTIINHDYLDALATQHRFLKTLASMVDFKKGGDTTAAIAIEETAKDFNFIVAVNDQGQRETAKRVLEAYLDHLVKILALPTEKHHAKGDTILLRRLAHYSKIRIKKEAKLLDLASAKCISHLQASQSRSNEDLISFLRLFSTGTGEDLISRCTKAYLAEKDPRLIEAQQLGRDPDDGSNAPHDVMSFKQLVHHVHRLAAHVRSVRRLIDDGARLKPLLEHYRVTAVSPRIPSPRPEADNLVDIEGILRRILPANDGRYEAMTTQLRIFDEQIELEAWIQSRFAPEETNRGSIHCEVQILEHFHQNRLRFARNDPYIGCSKPSCICCELYFRHHPLQCAQLDTHGRLYINWAPPLLADGVKDPSWPDQRRILGQIAHALGDLVISRLERTVMGIAARGGALFDSLDGHTVSGLGYVDIAGETDLGVIDQEDTDMDETSLSETDLDRTESSDSDEPGGAPL
ncbi:hypothetical protein Micbo1qcDRAFT_151179 [Microdochium bolleyi]|uniref:Uncharacterized protein n=1 Tax=Microdochium bolleyi TaxID=196109 RepID=A0A136ISZ3_9PEZI|nr:hypothetical protein Micbo1qcDRAFT_151179 [Microdochium bolleyi]